MVPPFIRNPAWRDFQTPPSSECRYSKFENPEGHSSIHRGPRIILAIFHQEFMLRKMVRIWKYRRAGGDWNQLR